MLIVGAAVFLLVAGIGVVASQVGAPQEVAGPGKKVASSLSYAGTDGEAFARLKDYTRLVSGKVPASAPPAGKLLPDVNTMTERLAARLENAPNDVKGWRMLGWSYFHTERYQEAAAAYARAAALDPSSAELKLSYEEAKAKAFEGDSGRTASAAKSGTNNTGGNDQDAEKGSKSDAMPANEAQALIRSMVDGLAARLESSPRDVEGWTRLMRSRVVLGESEVAATAFRRALEVFKDDAIAKGSLTSAAIELGLKAQ